MTGELYPCVLRHFADGPEEHSGRSGLRRRLGAVQGRVGDLLAGDLQAQVASLLLHESAQADSIALTQQTVADLLGVQRTSVSRVLHESTRRGVINVGYGHIAVNSHRGLDKGDRKSAYETPRDGVL